MARATRLLGAVALACASVPLVGVAPAHADESTITASNSGYFYSAGINKPDPVPAPPPNVTAQYADGVSAGHLAVAAQGGQEDKVSFVYFDVFSLPPGWCTPKIPGLGDVNWNSFFSALTDAGYGGPVCVEVEDDSYCHNDELRKQSLRVSRNVLRPLMGDSL